MTRAKRARQDRRRVHRGGRRDSDLVLSPELHREAQEYASEIEQCAGVLRRALEHVEYKTAKDASERIKQGVEAVRLLLLSGSSMKQA